MATLQATNLVQGHIHATVWPDAKCGVAIIPGDFHPEHGTHVAYVDWLDMQTDLSRFGLAMSGDFEPVLVAGCEVIEIRLAGAE